MRAPTLAKMTFPPYNRPKSHQKPFIIGQDNAVSTMSALLKSPTIPNTGML